ncbi:MAG: DUF2188 domain-containing protein [Melioribacteraceae bacterium]|nr:DUF2188 domain-containing protein [Melioribacteraceae bacterium]MCF8395723.1 DUF2188 domain-containing protein [Melioribacteraceae bacterium]MCF8421205.1 DUF2188 domain-containing protein [Melioribacteraceae bacterium]
MKNYHLTKAKDGWSLKPEGSKRATKHFTTDKESAIRESANLLKNKNTAASLKIHKTDGKIQEERTYPRSADPKKSKG